MNVGMSAAKERVLCGTVMHHRVLWYMAACDDSQVPTPHHSTANSLGHAMGPPQGGGLTQFGYGR